MPGVSVQIDRITKRYGAMTVVSDVSLDIAAGEFVALLGPSGSGKSTVLMSVAGFVEPSSGAIRVDGRDVTRVPPRQRNIGMVFQRYALFPHMTVEQNIAFPLIQRGMSRIEIGERIASVTKLVGLHGLETRPTPNLSGGQQQRVALARALVFQPPVLLMDEPLGALDKKMREHLQVEIKDIQRITGTTVVFVTHDQSEALGMADRLVVLNHGVVEQIGTPDELYEAPVNAFVADFIGETNVLGGRLVAVDADRCSIRLADGQVVDGTPSGTLGGGPESPVELVVRPKGISLGAMESGGLSALVLSTSYLGDTVNVRVRLANGTVLTAKEPASSTRVAGEAVGVRWSPRDARVFRQQRNERGNQK